MTSHKNRWNVLQQEINTIKANGLWRTEKLLENSKTHPEIVVDGVSAIDFSSNHYLGLGTHPDVQLALQSAVKDYGAGGLASRLIGGTMPPHKLLERQIATEKNTEDAILFGAGFLANQGSIPALAGPEDLIVSDERNHASLIDGCRFSRAKVVVVPHAKVSAFATALKTYGKTARRRLIVTDAIFSMDGDEAPLPQLDSLAKEEDAFLYVDEAHATGVYGENGEGLALSQGVQADISMGTLGKALGCIGAYIASTLPLCHLLRNRARSYVFTTSMPPAMAMAASVALSLSTSAYALRKRLWENTKNFRDGVKKLGISVPTNSRAPIVPLILGDPQKALAASAALLQEGIFAHAIRPPTVPKGTSRIRFTLLANHTEEHIESALRALFTHRKFFCE